MFLCCTHTHQNNILSLPFTHPADSEKCYHWFWVVFTTWWILALPRLQTQTNWTVHGSVSQLPVALPFPTLQNFISPSSRVLKDASAQVVKCGSLHFLLFPLSPPVSSPLTFLCLFLPLLSLLFFIFSLFFSFVSSSSSSSSFPSSSSTSLSFFFFHSSSPYLLLQLLPFIFFFVMHLLCFFHSSFQI